MNRVTAAERERILTRARVLQSTGVSYNDAIRQLRSEFGIGVRDLRRNASVSPAQQ